ncbi:MAG TPA: chromate transporter [Bacillota bacterium]
MDLMRLWDVFIAFTRATLLGYGGGPSIVPLYEFEVVDRFGWMTQEEFGRALAFGNSLPGPIATKMAAYIGYHVAGVGGAAVALFAVVLPTAVLMVALASLLARVSDHPFVQGAIRGVRPVVFVMLAMLALDFAGFAFNRGPAPFTFLPFAIAAGYFIAAYYFGVHPFWGVAASMLLGAVALR